MPTTTGFATLTDLVTTDCGSNRSVGVPSSRMTAKNRGESNDVLWLPNPQ
jgi:hypothetical protein